MPPIHIKLLSEVFFDFAVVVGFDFCVAVVVVVVVVDVVVVVVVVAVVVVVEDKVFTTR